MKRVIVAVVLVVGGALAVVTAIALLVAFGVVPLKTERTALIQETAPRTTQVALGSDMTPADIYAKYAGGVVEVMASFPGGDGVFGTSASSQALGSGFVASSDGKILTSAHVVLSDGQKATSLNVVFKDGDQGMTTVPAQLIGADETSDVALLKIDPAKAPKLVVLSLGDSGAVRPGEPVVAIGNPLGYDFSVTSGIVSAVNRNLQSPNGAVIANGIQTDAAINSGNSGGPLFNAAGQVIGINEQIASKSGGNEGLGFAVPINTAKWVMESLAKSGKVTYAYLGVQGQTLSTDIAQALSLKDERGVLVASVSNGSPADRAGLRGGSTETMVQGQVYVLGGDIITAIDGKRLDSAEVLTATILGKRPGDEVKLDVSRDGKKRSVTVKLGERPQ